MHATSAQAPGDVSRAQKWYVVFVLVVATILAYLDRGIISVLVPSLKADLGITDVQVSLLQGMSFALFFAVAGIPIGRLVDRLNRRNIIIIGVLVWSLMTLLCGMARDYNELLLARIGVGVGEATLIPAAYSIVADYFASDERGLPMSVLGCASAIGGAGASAAGGAVLLMVEGEKWARLLAEHGIAEWRATLIVFGLPGPLVALLLLTFAEPVRRSVAVAGGQGFWTYLREHRRVLTCFYLFAALNFVTAYSAVLWAPAALARSFEIKVGTAGIVIGLTQIASNLVGNIAAGLVGDRMSKAGRPHPRLGIAIAVLPITGIGSLVMAVAGTPVVFSAGFALAGFGTGVLIALAHPILFDIVPGAMRGRAAAVNMLIAALVGLGGGPLLVALLTDKVFADPRMLAVSIGLVGACSSVITLALLLHVRNDYARLRQAMQGQAATAP
ncbi:MAG TPA: MFS transporter [Novosphingobium sp.]|nr:MFS transporter [Novosphingobium sp.]